MCLHDFELRATKNPGIPRIRTLKTSQYAYQLRNSGQGGEHTKYDLAELFTVSRSTVYRAIARAEQ